jgi:hypothetical protein
VFPLVQEAAVDACLLYGGLIFSADQTVSMLEPFPLQNRYRIVIELLGDLGRAIGNDWAWQLK